MTFRVHHNGSPKRGIDYDTAVQVVSDAYRTWQAADCGGAGPSLNMFASDELFASEGPFVCDSQEYNKIDGNANAWIFQDTEWPYQKIANHLALTTLTFNPQTGEIYDVDVEINSADNPISVGDTNVSNDLLSIVTHEAGHFFGLSHTTVRNSTMISDYDNGTTSMRILGPDDISGICALYPPDRQTTACANSQIPRHGFRTECGVNEEKNVGCCATAPGAARSSSGPALFAAGLGLALFTLRRRRAPR